MTPTAGARAGVEQTIVDISNMNTLSMVPGGYNGFEFNNYANTNQGGGPIPSTQTSFRYEDNIHIRAGAPVSCSQIGFGSSIGPSTGPSTPAGVRLQ